jgi:flagellar hook assembly protein FlgD
MMRCNRVSFVLPIAIAAVVAFALPAAADRHWYATNVTSQLTMTKAESPHYVHGTLTAVASSVPPSYYGTITIEAGATVYFDTGAGIVVNGGKLVADGYWEPIALRYNGATPTTFGWAGVSIQNGTSTKSSTVRNVQISYGSGNYGGLEVWGGATPTLYGITVVGSRTNGVYIGSTVSTTAITAQGNAAAGMWTVGTASVACTSCTFSGNGGPGIAHWSSSLSLSSATITNNAGWAIEMLGTSAIPSLHVSSVTGNGGGTKNGIGIKGGSISGTLPGTATFPATIIGNVTVSFGQTLTIPAGRTVYFATSTKLEVQGKITASGTASSRITFVGATATPGSWAGLRLPASLDSTSTLAYVTIRHAASGIDMTGLSRTFTNLALEDNLVGILAGGSSSSSTVSSSTFARNNEAIRVGSGSGSFTCNTCTITQSSVYGLHVMQGSSGTLTNCQLTGNTGYAVATWSANALSLSGNTSSGNTKGILRTVGTISGTETWSSVGLDWHMSSVGVASSGTLTVAPGVRVRMEGAAALNVSGKLIAEGTASQPVVFTSLEGETQRGRWQHIYFGLGSSQSRLRHARLERGGYPSSAAVKIYQSTPTIDHVDISGSSGAGIEINQAVPTIRWVTIRDCTGSAVNVVNAPAPPVLRDSRFGNTGPVTANLLDARFCYWGSLSGPSGAGPGDGVGVPASASFEPWLAAWPSEPNTFTAATLSGREFNPAEGMSNLVSFTTALSGNWTLTFRNSAGTSVRSLSGSGASGSFTWNGTDQAGSPVPDGTYTWEATSVSGSSTAAPIRGLSIVDSARSIIQTLAVTEARFSPNGDTRKDTTRFDATLGFGDSTWTLQVRNSGGSGVRNWSGSGTSVTRTWDGKSDGGVLQPDGQYTAVLTVTAGGAQTARSVQTTIDITPPVALVSSPAQGAVVSNVRGPTQPVRATATDGALESWLLEYGIGTAPGSWFHLAEGSAPVSDQVIANWNLSGVPDGPAALALTVDDRAGNRTRVERGVQKSDFTVSQNGVWEFDPAAGSMAYVSKVPFDLYETITLRNEAGVVVRTLLNDVLRAAGTHTDLWDGKNDAGARVPDGAYSYVATAREAGGSPFVWDRSAVYRAPEIIRGITLSSPFDPFDNRPLGITYTLGKAHRLAIQARTSASGSFSGNCSPPPSGTTCVFSGYRPSGSHTIWWPGTRPDGTFFGGSRRIGAVALGFPENVTVARGSAPSVANVRSDPPIWHPARGATLTFDLAVHSGATASVEVHLIRQATADRLLTWSTTGRTSGTVTVPLDGHAANGLWLAEGPYTIEIVITDTIGNVVRAQGVMTVRY